LSPRTTDRPMATLVFRFIDLTVVALIFTALT
jgi:hypothetical protein